jgi:hypothetical protein
MIAGSTSAGRHVSAQFRHGGGAEPASSGSSDGRAARRLDALHYQFLAIPQW